MINVKLKKSAIKEGLFIVITLWIYVSIGVFRSYVSLLFYQLELPDSKIRLNNDEKTWIATGAGILSPLGSLIAGFFMDLIGRKKSVHLMFIPFVTAWIIVSLSSNYIMLLTGMITQSIGIGMGLCIVTYITEISSTKYRGLLIALVDVTYNFGVIFCNLLMYFFKWNIVSIIFIICTSISLMLTFMFPESPIWLYSKGKKEKAIQTLCAIRSKEVDQLKTEIVDLEKSCSTKSTENEFLHTLKNCMNSWRQFSIATIYSLILLLAGPFLILSYTVIILDSLKIPFDSALITVIYSSVAFSGSLMTPLVVHKFKRKSLSVISAGGMCISMMIIGVYEEIFYYKDEKPFAWIVPFSMCLYGMLCNMGVLPISFVIGGELFPTEARGTLQGLYGFTINLSWVISLKYYPLILFNFGIKIMIWVLFSFSLILVLFTIFVLPETKDKTFAEIQEQYFSKKNKDVDP